MFEHIRGKLISKNPAYVIVETTSGIGYIINVSLNTYSKIEDNAKEVFLFLHQVIREDAQLLFGFIDEKERKLFRHLINVSGVGANTARMVLSSLEPNQIIEAIVDGNVKTLQGVKGIGLKTAQRIVVDLRDKLEKVSTSNEIFTSCNNTSKDDALYALTLLGFQANTAKKAIEYVIENNKDTVSVEELIKQALKLL